jgi:hypothetical protein
MGEVTVKVKDDKGVEIDKILKDADVQEVLKGQGDLANKLAAAEGNVGKLKVVQDFMGKIGLDPDELIANADGAFTLISKLVEDGIIDPSGKVLVKKGTQMEPQAKKDGDLDLDALMKDSKGLTGEAKVAALVNKALESTLKPFAKTLDEITTVQTGMLRSQWEQRIQKEYPNLSTDDVRKVFGEAAVKPKLGILEIAKEFSSAKSTSAAALRAVHAKEFGIDLKAFDENKLTEKGPEGGAAVMFQGKTFTLSKRREGLSGFTTPLKATKEYLKKTGVIR